MKIKRVLKWSALVLFVVLFGWFQFAYWTSTNDCGRTVPASAERMKAIRYCEYGAPDDVLKLEQVEKPVPNDNQILVRVRAVSIRFFDGGMLGGSLSGRLLFGLRKPKNTCPGSDYAGTVEAAGRNVTEFKPGVEVFGVRAGALSEYICVRADRGAVALKPNNVTFEQAATIPTALVALQGLRDIGRVQAGQKVLINGASGGVGTFAVQIAKSHGAEVTGVCSTKNLELVRSIGADHVIDYTKEDFTKGDPRYDIIYDLINNRSFAERRRILKPGGICVLAGVGGSGMRKETLGNLVTSLTSALRSKFSDEKFISFGVDINKKDLGVLRDLTERGTITPALTKIYPLTETAAAYKYLATGHVQGKIAITID
ncbi:MAG TPA: NAD(P)-dependent alcohol dehydrogenase [Chthoniobacterales bacterium]|jgi:NADPH:quinone reductase-like Zn-dependent oxidoreductase|nr:NAD(P)-dependent alcohol dehydrogenase [Chthoniobacterales bacterium]